MLVKSAYTGVAAALIGGKTLHTLASLSLRSRGKLSNEARTKLQQFWKDKKYLIIDEYSMISKSFLAKLSHNIGIGKQGSNSDGDGLSFGGISVILCGDLHQFPPVAKGPREYLYRPNDLGRDPIECQIGRKIYEEFTMVVVLKEQRRVTDPVWHKLLINLRRGEVTEEDLTTLRKLIIDPKKTKDNFSSKPWLDAPLVTPRHVVRRVWNDYSTRKWCRSTGKQLFICSAEDTIGNRPLTLAEKYRLALRTGSQASSKNILPAKIEIAKGMSVLVTNNIETDLDITNGARGEIIDILLHPDEPPVGLEPIVNLKYMPSYVLIKLARTRASCLDGLEHAVIPVEALTSTMEIEVPGSDGNKHRRTVRRRQLPITPAYAFTDYQSQGQTITHVIVDIAPPPSGALSLFNVYVALSRSSGRDTIRLLRDFDYRVFKKTHDPHLLQEDERLESLDKKTGFVWRRARGV